MKKYRIVNKYRFGITISMIMILLFASMFFIVVNAKSTDNEILVPVYVSQGDSLWALSAEYSDERTDIRRYIDKVMAINNLHDANIKPGDLLMFPQKIK
jgi:hypothetical protein